MPDATSLIIASRFKGPPDSGNGGYVCGTFAVAAGAELRIRLLAPPPLDTPLALEHSATDGRWWLRCGTQAVASGTPVEPLELEVPRAPPYVQAVWASQHYVGFREHSFPECFVCGPHRRRGDGMRIFPGLLDSGMVAAPWIPADDLDGGDGKVAVEFHWAALDCPGYFAAIDDTPRTMLLGEMQAHVDRRVHVGEACMVLGWLLASEGRKHRCGTAIFDEDGELCARALTTWIAAK
mgnify:FL=1